MLGECDACHESGAGKGRFARLAGHIKSACRAPSRLMCFARATSGNVALIFALAAIPLLTAGGAAVDYSRAFLVQQRLSAALDATALAVGASTEQDEQKLRTLAQRYFDANYPAAEIGVPGQLNINITGTDITMGATASLPTAIMGIVGIDNMHVASEVEVTKERSALEVVLVLDNTGSMGSSGKIQALRQASRDLVDIMYGDDDNPENLKFGLVPFSASVNVGTQYANASWIDRNGASSLHGNQFENGADDVWEQYDELRNKSWNGCVEARPSPLDILDTPPDAGTPDTLFVPYFAPDEPDDDEARRHGYNYPNDYLDDDLGRRNHDIEEHQRNTGKYRNQNVHSDGPHFNCKNEPIQKLTNDKDTVRDALDRMQADGSTVIPIGLSWGWRVVSPGAPFTEGAEYSDEATKKVIILLTDGQNDIGNLDNHNRSFYSGYGHVREGRLGTTNASQAEDRLDQRTALLCDRIKDQDILLYTITFQLNNSHVRNLMRDCASSPGHFFDSPSNQQLRNNFQEIARQLSRLRISR